MREQRRGAGRIDVLQDLGGLAAGDARLAAAVLDHVNLIDAGALAAGEQNGAIGGEPDRVLAAAAGIDLALGAARDVADGDAGRGFVSRGQRCGEARPFGGIGLFGGLLQPPHFGGDRQLQVGDLRFRRARTRRRSRRAPRWWSAGASAEASRVLRVTPRPTS